MIDQIREFLIPKACPVELLRVGGSRDGAYLLPDDLDGISACFSPGVNNFKFFEDEVCKRWSIACHLCDFSSDVENFSTPLMQGMQTFEKKWLDITDDADSISLAEWVDSYAPEPSGDLLMQMDIEGAEYRNLLATSQILLQRFRVIVIELHGLQALVEGGELKQPIENLLMKLDETHVCVHAHPNNCCGDVLDSTSGMNLPRVIELTLLRRDRFQGLEQDWIQPQLPHPLDVKSNVSHKPPLHLNSVWLPNSNRSLASENKILEDQLAFAIHRMRSQAKERDMVLAINRMAHQKLVQKTRAAWLDSPPEDLSAARLDRLDVAQGKPFAISSAPGCKSTSGRVCQASDYFFSTKVAPHQSITIDLEEKHPLAWLVIVNRRDGNQDAARLLFWGSHDNPELQVDELFPVDQPDSFTAPNGEASLTPLFGAKGRYFTVYSPLNTALHFSELRLLTCSTTYHL